MGITNDLFPQELAFGITPEQMKLCDPIPDPEDHADRRTRRRGIDNFESFMKFLAPPGRGTIDESVRAGEAIFGAAGCASCLRLHSRSQREPGVQSQGGAAFQTCCRTTSAPLTASGRKPPAPNSGRRRCGASAPGR
jgi:hypothetical protein